MYGDAAETTGQEAPESTSCNSEAIMKIQSSSISPVV